MTSECKTSSAASSGTVVIALSEGRGPIPEVGMALFDLETSECTLSQFTDTPTFSHVVSKLAGLNLMSVLMTTACANPPTKLFTFISDSLRTTSVSLVGRQYWNEAKGKETIERYGVGFQLYPNAVQKYFMLVACAALFSYLESVQNMSFLNASIRFKEETIDGSMLIGDVF